MIILILLFLPIIVLGDSTETVITPDLIPPTTFQLIMEDINQLSTNIDKIEEIGKELAKNPDIITGQSLLNCKTYLEIEMKHEKQGRNYFGYIGYPVYIKEGL